MLNFSCPNTPSVILAHNAALPTMVMKLLEVLGLEGYFCSYAVFQQVISMYFLLHGPCRGPLPASWETILLALGRVAELTWLSSYAYYCGTLRRLPIYLSLLLTSELGIIILL